MASSAKKVLAGGPVELDMEAINNDTKLIIADLVSFAKATDGGTLVGALLDALSTEMTTTSRNTRSKSGSAVVKLALKTMAPDQFKTAVSVADNLVSFGIISEEQIEGFVEDPSPIVEAVSVLFKPKHAPVKVLLDTPQ